MEPVVIIGVGNPLRGDDGAGREAARRLQQKCRAHVRVIETEGEATTLLSLMHGANLVYLIDACVSGAVAGSFRRIDLAEEPLPEAAYGLSSHGFGLAEALALGRALGSLPPHCVVFAIEAESFDMGAPLSEAVNGAVDTVVAALREEVEIRR